MKILIDMVESFTDVFVKVAKGFVCAWCLTALFLCYITFSPFILIALMTGVKDPYKPFREIYENIIENLLQKTQFVKK
jgi:predicted nucleic-acid-binding protein